MFSFRHMFARGIALPESEMAHDQKGPLLADLEKSELSEHHFSVLQSKAKVDRKRPIYHRVLVLTLVLSLALLLRPLITEYAALAYNTILKNSHTYLDHVHCGQHAGVDQPISIAAPPWAGDPVEAKPLDRNGWEATCSSTDTNSKYQCKYAIDSDGVKTVWQSGPGTSHWIMIDLKNQQKVHSLAMSPSKRGEDDGGMVRRHRVQIATDAGKWTTVAMGSWRDIDGLKYATFEPQEARFVNLTIIDTTQDQNFVAIGDIGIYGVDKIYSAPPNGGRWGITIDLPLVPVTAFLNPISRKLVTQASYLPDKFNQNDLKRTYSATWDPQTGNVVETLLSSSKHDMFCPGTSFDEKGSVIVTGGDTPSAFSIYDSSSDTWSTPIDEGTGQPKTLKVSRGYQGQTFMANGGTFMIGGAWSGGAQDKNGEIYDPKTGDWQGLPNIEAKHMKMDVVLACADDPTWDPKCVMTEWEQHHAWLFAWKKNSIFHAGPSKQMNWFFTDVKDGSRKDAGLRADDFDAVCAVTSMYDAEAGTILTAGGSRNYHYWVDVKRCKGEGCPHRNESSQNAFEITLGEAGGAVKIKKIAPMIHRRIFANGVILPTGETLVVGGQLQGEPFYDDTWQPIPEIYSPDSGTWREVARHSTPRGYHSWAMLLPDASVVVGGAGLDRPESDHYDAQIYYPSYFFKSDGQTPADRPKITTIDSKKPYKLDGEITITTDVGVDAASLIRYSAATHALNNDLRRIKLKLNAQGSSSDKKYTMTIPKDPGVALPGYWMLFVLRDGVPSLAETVQILAN